ncbi:MAG: DUF4407 domain-containing protein [Bacteroidota bacterium]|nr:DUF4407 domain-containing protein [Bacteroidota bacterium]
MPEAINMLSRRESYAPKHWEKFLWWLSTAQEELIKDCVVDRSRYAIIGSTVLSTWLFATLAWSYFFYTAVSNDILSLLLGVFMGGVILTIDRALIKGVSSSHKRKLLPLLFRATLALTIGTFMAQPALLYLFNKEISMQASLDNEQRKKDKLKEQQSTWQIAAQQLQEERKALQAQLDTKYQEVAAARNAFISETDGTGGSKKIGLKAVAQAKQAQYEKLDGEYRLLSNRLLPQIAGKDSALAVIQNTIHTEQLAFEKLLNNGFLTRMEALSHLLEKNATLRFRYYLLVMILVLIELMPVLSKTMLPSGSYDAQLNGRGKMEQNLVQQNLANEEALKQLYNRLAFEYDREIIENFFREAEPGRKTLCYKK